MSTTHLPELPWQAAGAVDTSHSAHARLRPVPIHAVTMGDGFWKPRMEGNRTSGIAGFLAWLDEDGQVAPFRAYAHFARTGDSSRIAAALDTLRGNYTGRNSRRMRHTWRAAVMKVVEACAFTLQSVDDPEIRDLMDELVTGIVAAHDSTEFWQAYYGDNFEHSYQLATPGHLIQAAVAHHRATGRMDFLDVAVQVADAVAAKFEGRAFAEHACIEMALVELWRSTGEARIFRLAAHFAALLMEQPPVIGPDAGEGRWHHFNRHVVRQTYLPAGAADLLAEQEDQALSEQLLAIWRDMMRGKLQVTGHIAVDHWMPERITAEPFALSEGALGNVLDHINHGFELCESIGNIMWAWRMLMLTADAAYADQLERALYNGLLPHIGLDDRSWFYLCPMASDGDHPSRNGWGNPSTGCCPANAVRFVPSLPSYLFSTSRDAVWVHLYDDCGMEWRLPDGSPIALQVRTRYPWSGRVELQIGVPASTDLTVHLRIPGWCDDARADVNGERVSDPITRGSYLALRRTWNDGDVITLDLPTPVVGMEADPRARDFQGLTAIMRGPLLYCFEGVDNAATGVRDLKVGPGSAMRAFTREGQPEELYQPTTALPEFLPVDQPDLLGGVTVLRGPAEVSGAPAELTAIPYYAWANRGPSPMSLWIDHAAGERRSET